MIEHRKALFLFARSLGIGREDAEDIVQETLLRAHLYKHQFNGGAYRSWLYGILRNLHYSKYRREKMKKRWQHRTEQDDMCESPFDEICELAALNVKMQSLPEIQSTALCDWLSGMEYDEIARARAVPLGTIKSRIARARAALC